MLENRYTPELAADILKAVSEGHTLRRACRDRSIPESTVRGWFRDNRDGLGVTYQQARSMQIDCLADEIIETAYDDTVDPQTARVRVDAIKWLLSKLRPTAFGDRLLVGSHPDAPLKVAYQDVDKTLAEMPTAALDALEAFVLSVQVGWDGEGGRRLIEHKSN